MNRTLLLFLLLVSPFVMQAQKFISETNDSTLVTEYNNDRLWAYRNIEGITVGTASGVFKDEYDTYYQIGLFIHNNSESPITFNPEEVYARFLTNKGDTADLDVYTHEKLQKKIKRSQGLSFILGSIAGGFIGGFASITTGTRMYPGNGNAGASSVVYNADAENQPDAAVNVPMQTIGTMLQSGSDIRDEGYLKLNTIHPGSAILGFMNVKFKQGRRLRLEVVVGNRTFSYLWDIETEKDKEKRMKKEMKRQKKIEKAKPADKA